MKLYVAGPMTGHEAYNVVAFERAQEKWRRFGHEVETPFDANSRVWERHHGRAFDPYKDRCEYGDPVLLEMFAEDLRVLCMAEGVVLLEGWEKSKGARAELLVACNFNKRIFLDATGEEVVLRPSVAFERAGDSALLEAHRVVHGDRGDCYGHPIDDFTRTGRLWAPILEAHWIPGTAVPPEAVALCMVQVKVSRECNHPKKDNAVDGAGYFETLTMVRQRQGTY